jgi:hypothetical protein
VPRLGARRPVVGTEFVDDMRDPLEFHPSRLSKFVLGLCATALNPSGASILDLKQRTERSKETSGG